MKFLVVTLGLLFSISALAQKLPKKQAYQRHYNEIFPKSPQFKSSGWLLAPGATYMLTRFVPRTETLSETASTSTEAKFSPLGKPGIYAEGGRYQMLRYNPFFKYLDYGLSYTMMRGREKAEATITSLPAEALISSESATANFGYHYAQAFVNFNHNWRLGRYQAIQHSLGVNAGYAVMANLSGNTVAGATVNSPGRWLGQAHYKLGYVVKMRGNWLLIPTLETPISNFLPFEPLRSAMPFATSRYRPIILSIRLFFIRPVDPTQCTPVRTREGWQMPTDMDKQQQMEEGGGQ